ncbi:MAG: four helix bundle protein [Prevotellaceae bacterium]|jgi:four helix bundle protein|nr:four helix bundle protein [Prevotellaceae bacterium]
MNVMTEQIKNRTKKVGIKIIQLIDLLPQKTSSWVISKQIVRSATSIGANYRAACRAKSVPDFLNKLKIVEEETDETLYWLEIIEEAKLLPSESLETIKTEINEILSIVVASIKTIQSKIK